MSTPRPWLLALLVIGCSDTTPVRPPPAVPQQADEPHTPAPAAASRPSRWREVGPGLRYGRRPISDTGETAEVFVADPSRVRWVAIDARSDERLAGRVAELRTERDIPVAVNGTFFDEEYRPLGLLVDAGRELNPLRDADWGVLETTARGTARLVHTTDYEAAADREFAVQCGPRVVIDGRVPRLEPQSSRRTAACLRRDGDAVLLVTLGSVDATALGEWMAAPDERGLSCLDAVLLDGGPSTQLSAKSEGFELDVAGGWGVPNAIDFAWR